MVPQGTLAERIRAGGAGIPGFFTRQQGLELLLLREKNIKNLMVKHIFLEEGIVGDFAFVKAWKADKLGNLIYRKTARNFNPLAAMSGKITIAEVEEIVEVGELNPDEIHTPGIYVQRVLLGSNYNKRIERRTVRAL
ncbi:hypothetical protein GCM10020331_074590 [Ectobacillus funiculus]